MVEQNFLDRFGQSIWTQATSKTDYWLTRFLILRLLGLIYLVAFFAIVFQAVPLIGENGLTPATLLLKRVESFWSLPTLFWFQISDGFMMMLGWIGVVLAATVLLGLANVPILFILWLVYLSFVNIGQVWYSFGWEIQLLETGFLAIFLVPLVDPRPFPRFPPPVPVIWLLRWLIFRLYLGAGLIKIRGDQCWRDLTCLFYHYETQPIPNPLSPWFHILPKAVHKLGTLFNHFVELIVPFFVFSPRNLRHLAGLLIILFQVTLILSGNLSFLNWITIVAAVSMFDDRFLRRILPSLIVKARDQAVAKVKKTPQLGYSHYLPSVVLTVVVAILSGPVIFNLLSPTQRMNTSFNQLHIVNTYGAFGAVGAKRHELIIEGTSDEKITAQTQWQEYQFKAKPGDPNRRLPIVAPYHYRVDWLMWFAAMAKPQHHPWIVNLVWKLLHNDQQTLSLLTHNPFMDNPPNYIRVELYRYWFVDPRDKKDDAVWNRTRVGTWLQPLSKSTPELKQFIKAHQWNLYKD